MSGDDVLADAAVRRELIRDLSAAHTGFGIEEVPNGALVGDGRARSASCGDDIAVRIVLDGGGQISVLRWQGRGCEISLASASALAGSAVGLTVAEFEELFALHRESVHDVGTGPSAAQLDGLGDAVAFFGVGLLPLRSGCATLAWRAAADAFAHVRAVGGRDVPAVE